MSIKYETRDAAMDMHELIPMEPPGAYAVADTRETEPFSHPNGGGSQAVEPAAEPTLRRDTLTLTLPEAIRNDSDASRVATCYCGHCSACALLAEAKSADRHTAATHTKPSTDEERAEAAGERDKGPAELTEAEKREVEELQRRDQEVRAHEQAHAAAGATNVRYQYQTGPDGRPYAVGGSADIQIMAMGDDYDSRIAQARKMRAAALAPGDPSPQDMAVAAKATRLEAEALADKVEEEREPLTADDQHTDSSVFDMHSAPSTHQPFFALV